MMQYKHKSLKEISFIRRRWYWHKCDLEKGPPVCLGFWEFRPDLGDDFVAV
jgi:hypothetical protein